MSAESYIMSIEINVKAVVGFCTLHFLFKLSVVLNGAHITTLVSFLRKI